MKTEDTVEYNSLRWVKKELDLILQEAQASLSAYIEDSQDADRLRESVEHLHMVQGTLQMVELYGAAQLAEEMEKVSEALLNGKIEKVDDAYDVLMRSMLQLPDYLESLQSGSKDVPMVLLPLLNDLRATRNASLLSENVLFFPDVESADASAGTGVEAGQLLATAKKLRPHYQIGLLGWFKGEKIGASLKRISAVLGELEKKSSRASTQRIWTISSALVEGLSKNGIDSNVSIKMLLGQVDRTIKQLIDSDEDVFAKNTPSDLLKNLLYYVARIKTESPRVSQVKATYRLEELLPADNELEEVRSGMGGLNTELLSTVSSGIREDLLEVKDALEIFVHSEVQDVGRLSSLPDLLAKIADTLSMLGLGMPREQVLEQQAVIKNIISGSQTSSDELIMNVAGVLLSVESQLNSFIANRSSAGSNETGSNRLGDFGDMPESEYLEVLSAVIREALQDFNDARQAILNYLENPTDKSLLEMVLTKLEEVDGAMFMLPVQKLKHQIDAVRQYLRSVMINAGHMPDANTQNDLADVVTSVEYYLEALKEGRPDLELSMSSGDAAADRLIAQAREFGTDVQAEVEDSLPEPVVEEEIIVEEPVVTATEEKTAVKTEAVKPSSSEEEQRYVVLGDDADEEILEIFIEEALEELASLSEQLPLWQRDHNNQDALTTIRRSFHTLKGSGRLIGAELIGEFAWNFENMLNRVIDKSRPLTPEVFEILDESLTILPQLIEQLKGNRDPVPNIYQLIDRADALGKWQKPLAAEKESDTSAASIASDVGSVNDNSDSSESHEELDLTEDLDLMSDIGLSGDNDIHETESSVELDISDDELMAEISEDELMLNSEDISVSSDLEQPEDSQGDALEDDFDIDLTDELEALQIGSSDDGSDEIELLDEVSLDEFAEELIPDSNSSEDHSLSEDTLQIYIDPVLFDIFKSESESHLKEVRSMLEQHHQGVLPMSASSELLRALHTLFGSARTAEVDEIAELCGGLEKYVRLFLDRDSTNIPENGVYLIEKVTTAVTSMLAELENKNQRLESDTALLSELNKLSDQAQRADEGLGLLDNAMDVSESDEVLDLGGVDLETLELNDEVAPEPVAKASQAAPVESLVSYSDVDDELVDIFLEEAEELLDSCENNLQIWNSDNSHTDSVMELQRHLHTLKGGARMADLSPVGDLTHALESLIIAVNDGHVSFSKNMSTILHDSLDQLSDMLSKVKNREPMSTAESLIANIDAMRQGKEVAVSPPAPAADDEEDPEPALTEPALNEPVLSESGDEYTLELTEESVLSEDFTFEEPLEVDVPASDVAGYNKYAADDASLEDADAYEVELDAGAILEDDVDLDTAVNVSALEEVAAKSTLNEPEAVSISEKVKKKPEAAPEKIEERRAEKPAAKDGIANEQVRVRSDLLNELVNHAGEVSVYHARMGQQITNFSFNLSEMEQTVVRLREQLRKLSIETEAQILSRYEKETDQYGKDFDPLEMDRFSTMQQISRSLQETVSDIESIKELLGEEVRDAETLLLQESRVSTELQEGLMRTRMVHFGGLASRLRRIVRQTARELDKDVELNISGETSEVDRTVLDRIVAPLEHMLRNAVSHGIEKPAERLSKGKAESGRLSVSVDREGGDVVILVKDDGRGIDVSAIRKKATEKGLLDPSSKLSDHDVLQYIMEPGFSTAEKVTQISGRGVGMDVVDSEIKQLGGVLEIDTVEGKGTTFTIRLPLTLAINHALLVSVGEEVYAVPLNSIEGVVRLSGLELQQFYDSGENHYEFAGSSYELKHLGRLLTGVQPDYSSAGQLFPVLLSRVGDQSVALHVDDLIGRREIVVKPVGAQISTVRGVSGATILGDGRVVIILEMNALVLGDSLFHVAQDEQLEEGKPAEVVVEEVQRETLVMVVDDSITIRKVTERMLSRHNMKVITAKDGVDAVSQLQEVKPDVMLLDIEMPRMDGYEVATHIRNDERLKDLPIIMITSRSGAKHRDKAMEIGVNKYLGKPYQEDDLMENINELIG